MAELIWEGKYDKNGDKVAPLRVQLPFQTVETVNESAQERQKKLDLFGSNRSSEWRNRLVWGDKKYVLPALLEEFAGQVDLIYIDPPFATGQDFSFSVSVNGEDFTKEPSIIEQKAYRDTWGRGLGSYLQWFYETTVLLRELLKDTGSIYIQLDWHIGHYAKTVLDEVFGSNCARNAIIWKRTSAHNDPQRYGIIDDTIFFYTKSDKWTWNNPKTKYEDWYIQRYYRYIDDKTGRRFLSRDITGPSHGNISGIYEWKEKLPGKGRMWAYTRENMEKLEADGRLFYTENGIPRLKQFLDEMEGNPVQSIWDDILPIVSWSTEGYGYDTQKPQALLDRIVSASSNENDLVLDCFVGSGTTAAVAEKLSRRWIACDLGRFAIHTSRKRLLSIPDVKPFVIQNLGKYERQLWQAAEFGEKADERMLAYRRFILELYKAQAIKGYNWLHGVKAGRMCKSSASMGPFWDKR